MDRIGQQPTVLIAEPDALVAMDLCDALEQAGYRVVGPYATQSKALAAMAQEIPDLAVVDIVLKDGICTALEHALRRHGVRYVVHTGVEPGEPHAAPFQDAPWLGKPALPGDVVMLLGELMRRPAAALPADPMAAVPLLERVESRPNPFIRKLEGFVALSDADRMVLGRISAKSYTVAPRTDLVREGDAPEGVFLILQGMACRHKQRRNGARQILAYLLPGDLCDLDVALLDAMDHSMSTLSACEVVLIAPETVTELMRDHPLIARGLRVSTLVDEATLREWLVNVGSRSALERIAHLFCEMAVRLRAVARTDGESFAFPLTQSELGDTTGLSTVHVNRSLQELRRRGLIELERGRLTILDLPELQTIGEFKPNYLHLGDRAAA